MISGFIILLKYSIPHKVVAAKLIVSYEVTMLFLAHLAQLPSLGVHHCCHLLSTVIIVIFNFSKHLSSDTTGPVRAKLGMNVLYGILHRGDVEIFYLLANMDATCKNRT